ncbi:MAG: TIGR04255 family protein [Burkholderiaceae bacterium]|jgi:uncharacterized protein (TIGR04255 family)|nr:TIGR04255 family protein [Burkholderiaceae bacterium]MEB2351612.1 TIGR04255 family protein [Burkholderiaceae bacterium]
MTDFLYADPPLVEVIAEVHWALQKIASIPGSGVDPLYARLIEQLRGDELSKQFGHEERLIPEGVPQEFFGNKPLVRFRPKEKAWPLYQFGPGIFVTNVTPPYRGWASFRQHLEFGIDALLRCYPAAKELLKVSRLQLRYMDAFTRRHGFDRYSAFVQEGLGMSLQLPSQLLEESAQGGGADVQLISEVTFPLKKIHGTQGQIKVAPGTSGDESAVFVEFSTTYQTNNPSQVDKAQILEWFNSSHVEVRRWFELLPSEQIKRKFGQRTDI